MLRKSLKPLILTSTKCFLNHKKSLKTAFDGKFLIGTTTDEASLSGRNFRENLILERHFNSLTVNALLPLKTIPEAGRFNFEEADRQVELALKKNFHLVGHFLICPIFFPQWFFTDENGADISRTELVARMENYMTTMIRRYKGKIKVWEVAHEAFDNDGHYIDCKFLKIIGEDYVKLAFDIARRADPDCELCYSDFALSMPAKREATEKMIADLQKRGTRIDSVGIQGHCHLNFPVMSELEKSIVAFAKLGCKVSITELDMSVLPVYNPKVDMKTALNPAYWESLNPYRHALPQKIADIQHRRYREMFEILLKHSDKIDRVTFWGISDKHSFKNIFPVPGRTDYPLLFDRKYRAKPIVRELIEMGKNHYY